MDANDLLSYQYSNFLCEGKQSCDCHLHVMGSSAWKDNLNPLDAQFFRGNKNIYLHFVSFLHIDTMLVV